jgi:hypothetical protein
MADVVQIIFVHLFGGCFVSDGMQFNNKTNGFPVFCG